MIGALFAAIFGVFAAITSIFRISQGVTLDDLVDYDQTDDDYDYSNY